MPPTTFYGNQKPPLTYYSCCQVMVDSMMDFTVDFASLHLRPCPVVAWQRLDGRGLASGAAGSHEPLRGVVSNRSFSVVNMICNDMELSLQGVQRIYMNMYVYSTVCHVFGCMMTSEKGSTQRLLHTLFFGESRAQHGWLDHLWCQICTKLEPESCANVGSSLVKSQTISTHVLGSILLWRHPGGFGIETEFQIPLQIAWHLSEFGEIGEIICYNLSNIHGWKALKKKWGTGRLVLRQASGQRLVPPSGSQVGWCFGRFFFDGWGPKVPAETQRGREKTTKKDR